MTKAEAAEKAVSGANELAVSLRDDRSQRALTERDTDLLVWVSLYRGPLIPDEMVGAWRLLGLC